MTKLIVAFRNFANAPKNDIFKGIFHKYERRNVNGYVVRLYVDCVIN